MRKIVDKLAQGKNEFDATHGLRGDGFYKRAPGSRLLPVLSAMAARSVARPQ